MIIIFSNGTDFIFLHFFHSPFGIEHKSSITLTKELEGHILIMYLVPNHAQWILTKTKYLSNKIEYKKVSIFFDYCVIAESCTCHHYWVKWILIIFSVGLAGIHPVLRCQASPTFFHYSLYSIATSTWSGP